MLPTFIIAGPPKAGTSSLQHYIDVHPDIYIPDGEAHFFCEHYDQGPDYYKDFFKGWSNQKAVGEKTPCYFYRTDVPARIKNLIPDIKLLFIYRNPIDRAYSQYWHNVRRGVENDTFEVAIKKEIKREQNISSLSERIQTFFKNEPGLFSYVSIGQYAEHIKRWEDTFDKSQMFHIVLEDLNHSALHDVLRFLKVNDDFAFGDLKKKFNVGGRPRSIWLMKATRRFEYVKPFHDGFDRFLNFKRGEYPTMDPSLRKYLGAYFSPYNEEFETVTGLSVKKWKQ